MGKQASSERQRRVTLIHPKNAHPPTHTYCRLDRTVPFWYHTYTHAHTKQAKQPRTEIDSAKARGAAGAENGDQADEAVVALRNVVLAVGRFQFRGVVVHIGHGAIAAAAVLVATAGQLHNRHANGEQHECRPLGGGKLALQEERRKEGRGQDFELVADLVGRGVQIGQCEV